MLMRKIKKVLKWLGAMLLVFVISFLGTAAANDSLSVDQILTGKIFQTDWTATRRMTPWIIVCPNCGNTAGSAANCIWMIKF